MSNIIRGYSLKSNYVMLADNGLVKIGISNSIGRRKEELEKEFGVKIDGFVFNEPNNYAEIIEEELHDIFSRHWVHHEWFNVDVEMAIEAMQHRECYYRERAEDFYSKKESYYKLDKKNIVKIHSIKEWGFDPDDFAGLTYFIGAVYGKGSYYELRAKENDYFAKKYKEAIIERERLIKEIHEHKSKK